MSPGHIFAVAGGFGLRLTPVLAPYRFRLGALPSEIDSECRYAEGWRLARVMPADSGFQHVLGPDTVSLSDVLHIEPGPAWDAWWIETTRYRIPLLPGWTLHAEGDAQGPLFDLLGPGDCDLFVQTPRTMPVLEELLGPNQQAHGTGQSARSSWIELSYMEAGRAWIQRHEVLQLGDLPVVVTLQAPEEQYAACDPVLASVVDQIQSNHPGSGNPPAPDAVR